MPGETKTNPLLKLATQPILFFGWGLIVLGALSIFAPDFAGMTVGVAVGIYLLFGGILRTAFAWVAGSWGTAILRFLLGILTVVAGGFMIFQPATGLQAITIVLAIYFLVDGVVALLLAFGLPPAAGGAWVMAGGVISIGLAVAIYLGWPQSGEAAVGLLVGVKLVLEGGVLVAVATALRALGRALQAT